jgi:hypothetical protein
MNENEVKKCPACGCQWDVDPSRCPECNSLGMVTPKQGASDTDKSPTADRSHFELPIAQERVWAADIKIGDVIVEPSAAGRVTGIDTYNLGGKGGAAHVPAKPGEWPCLRLYIGGVCGIARFPSEFVTRLVFTEEDR